MILSKEWETERHKMVQKILTEAKEQEDNELCLNGKFTLKDLLQKIKQKWPDLSNISDDKIILETYGYSEIGSLIISIDK